MRARLRSAAEAMLMTECPVAMAARIASSLISAGRQLIQRQAQPHQRDQRGHRRQRPPGPL
ncbi:hypothetical protein SCWH03_28770 [Streptomyces pacificus]|uniref:Uncharacterized protein n=1 Tax=Streptomyces pacificus TaxID=2705029 RepID=A0A6A0AUU7_9ACTN|nr:hypothetical protein SCWH03_28770 [Streptomyces pacificus]